MAVFFVLANALMLSISNVLGGVAARMFPLAVVLIVAGPVSAALAVLFALTLPGTLSPPGFWVGLIAGIAGGAGLPIAYRAFSIGPVGMTAATIAVASTALLTGAGIAGGDVLTPARTGGLALCLVSIVLVTYQPTSSEKQSRFRGPVLALVAAVLFTAFVLVMNEAPSADGFWPLVGARVGVCLVALVLIAALIVRTSWCGVASTVASKPLHLPVLAGATDVIGNVFLVLALQVADLILLAIMAPTAPVITALIGRVFLRENLSRTQFLGLGTACGALILASF